MRSDTQNAGRTKKRKRLLMLDMTFMGILLLFVAFSFFTFTKENRQRIVEQNNAFVETAARQTVSWINDLIDRSYRNVQMMSRLYGATMESPEISPDMLQNMTEESAFDYVEFISLEDA